MSNKELIPITFSCYDLLEQDYSEENDMILYEYADYVYRSEGYDSPDDFLQNVISVEHFTNPTFHVLLKSFFDEKRDVAIDDENRGVRGYMPDTHGGFYMTHGFGYSIWSEDLYGGTADGRARYEFEDYLKEKGFFLCDEDYFIDNDLLPSNKNKGR